MIEYRGQFMLSLCSGDSLLDWIRFNGSLIFKGSKADIQEWVTHNTAPMGTSYVIWDIQPKMGDTTDGLWNSEKQCHDSKSDLSIFLGNLYLSILRQKDVYPRDLDKLQKTKKLYGICDNLNQLYINCLRDLSFKRNSILWRRQQPK